MSKAVRADHEFNKEKYIELLIKAQGGRTQTEFAKDCNVSVSYMCKCLNGIFKNAPTPSTIKKIAACAACGVTYSELLEASGYDSSKYNLNDYSVSQTPSSAEYEKMAMATIAGSLSKCSFKWSPLPISSDSIFDFGISVENEAISQWYFKFLQDTTTMIPYQPSTKRFAMCYMNLVMEKHSPFAKFSFVVDSEKLYDEIKSNPPYMLSMYVSVFLIDANTVSIIKEEYLNTSTEQHSPLCSLWDNKQ